MVIKGRIGRMRETLWMYKSKDKVILRLSRAYLGRSSVSSVLFLFLQIIFGKLDNILANLQTSHPM